METLLPEDTVIPQVTVGPETGASNQGWVNESVAELAQEPAPAPAESEA